MADLCLLEDFQLEGAKFLADRKHAFLADEPGVGKSAQAIRACDLVGAENILVLVPASVRVNWLREFEKFSPFDRDGVAVMDAKTQPAATGVTVCSYALITPVKVDTQGKNAPRMRKMAAERERLRKSLLARQWDVLILDEAHCLKERSNSSTKAVYGRLSDGAVGLAACSSRVWRLSGTPAPNYVDEMWTHLRAAGIYPRNYYDYVTEFCTGFTSDYGFRITGTKNAARLTALLSSFMLRRKKKDVLPTLPPIEFEHVVIEPAIVDEEVYFPETALGDNRKYLHDELKAQNEQLKDAVAAGNNTLDYLRSIAPSSGTLRRYLGISKVPAYLAHVIPELRALKYGKLVIGAWHSTVIEMLRTGLHEFGAITLHGETPADKRQARLDRFKNNRACRVLIVQVRVAIGFNATKAYRVDILEPSWVPAENKQCIDRVHRIGQDHPVTARFFGCARSVDADITKALAQKSKEIAKVFD